MTHAELRTRLRAYADGTLGEPEAELVRVHLGSGCVECLRDVFTRPVGLPRTPVVLRRGRHRLGLGLLAGAALGGMAAVVTLDRTRGEVVEVVADPQIAILASEIERLRGERDRAETAARERIDRLEARVLEAEQRTAMREAPPPTVRPPSFAARGTGRPPSPGGGAARTEAETEARTESRTEAGWLHELLASDGARVVPLGPEAPAPNASGFAVWSPARGVVVVSATNLPIGSRDAVYRARVTLSDQSTVWVGDVTASNERTLTMTVTLPGADGRRVTRVDLYRDPPGAPVLTARLGP